MWAIRPSPFPFFPLPPLLILAFRAKSLSSLKISAGSSSYAILQDTQNLSFQDGWTNFNTWDKLSLVRKQPQASISNLSVKAMLLAQSEEETLSCFLIDEFVNSYELGISCKLPISQEVCCICFCWKPFILSGKSSGFVLDEMLL